MEEETVGKYEIPIKLSNKKIQVKRKYGKHPAKFIPSLIELLKKKTIIRNLITRRK